MEQSAYGLSITLPVSFETAVQQTSVALKAEGFGVLTTIDVQQTLKTKLDRSFAPERAKAPVCDIPLDAGECGEVGTGWR